MLFIVAIIHVHFINDYSHANHVTLANQNKPNIEKNIDEVSNELKKLKALLDSGVITQEDYDAKKKKLLGL